MYLTLLLGVAAPAYAFETEEITIDPDWLEQNMHWLSEPAFTTDVSNAKPQPKILVEKGYEVSEASEYGCADSGRIHASSWDMGHTATARLTPPGYPFIVTSVNYTLISELSESLSCSAGNAHDVLVMVADSMDPGEPPMLLEAWTVEESFSENSHVEFSEGISPIQLEEGHVLIVAVEMMESDFPMCIATCADDYQPDSSYWMDPNVMLENGYDSWDDLGSGQGVDTNLNIGMAGLAPGLLYAQVLSQRINQENFESGALDAHWTTWGSADWFVQSGSVHEQDFAAECGNINDYQDSFLGTVADFPAGGDVSFWHAGDTESSWDFFEFRIDGILQLDQSGNWGWTHATFPVSAGQHTFEWRYRKDGSVSWGADTVWIDDVQLPGATP